MVNGKRMVAVVIGVADPSCDRTPSDLAYLKAAINSAHSFFEWATAVGYEARLLTDEDQPVTMAKLRATLEESLPPHTPPAHRLVLYFAGHGLLQGVEQALWLLSAWRSEGRAVGVRALQRMLYRYGLAQISIFADACRSLPASMDCVEVTADGVLGIGPEPRVEADVDMFVAAQDAAQTYAIPGDAPEQDRCIFSGVLLEGLWGLNPAAFSTKTKVHTITGPSLKTYLKFEVPRIATRYNVELNPSASTSFDENDNIYLESGAEMQPPKFQPWPPLKSLLEMGWPKGLMTVRVAQQTEQRPPLPDCSGGFAPPTSIAVYSPLNFAVWMHNGNYTKPRAIGSEFWSAAQRYQVTQRDITVWMGVAVGFPTKTPRPAVIVFEGGIFAPVIAIPDLTVALRYEPGHGVSEITYSYLYGGGTPLEAEAAIAQIDSGRLQQDALEKLTKSLANYIRRASDIDPIVGVINAYIYDSIGDVDTIRRIAFYFANRRRAIPYDIALLAHLKPIREDNLGLWVQVPALPKRTLKEKDPMHPPWTRTPTASAEGLLAGNYPWMRQGWAFLDEFVGECAPALVQPIMFELRKYLTVGRFTTLSREGGLMFASMLELSDVRATKTVTV
jgi:hypothetical protein